MDVNNTSEKIKQTIDEIAKMQAIKRHFDATVEEEQEILKKKEAIETQMVKELADITELEKLGVKSIFHKVLGDKEKQMEKERQEYLQVTLQHKEIINALEVVEYERSLLEKKMVQLDELQSKLEALKQEREYEIMSSSNPLKNELSLLYKKRDELNKLSIEFNEAILAGHQALSSLGIVRQHMKVAKDWGNWDMMSKSRRYKYLKHGAIDKAMREISRSRLMLRNLNKELEDVGYSNKNIALNIDSINNLPNVFFDNLISDWIMQTKIKGVLTTVEDLIDDISVLQNSLRLEKDEIYDQVDNIEKQRNKLLEEN